MIYVSIDGDSVGKKIEAYILKNQLEELREFNIKFSDMISKVEAIFEKYDSDIYLRGGDNILAKLPHENLPGLIEELKELLRTSQINFSMGVGKSVEACFLALKNAKAIHNADKLKIVQFDFTDKITIL